MNWEEMTPPEIKRAARTCKGVCVVPMGCLESHGDHMPVGTDCFQIDAMVKRAAEIEPVVKFPVYFQTQIAEAAHLHGTFSLKARLIWDLLEGTLGEIARNGFKKIVLVNGHGGNYNLLPYFAFRRMEAPRDYALYLYRNGRWPLADLPEAAEVKDDERFLHGGEIETSLMMAIRPDLVKRDKLQKSVRTGLGSLKTPEDFETGFNWFANNPDHYQGGGEYGTADKGRLLLDLAAKRLAKAFKAVKSDTATRKIMDEFFRCDVGNAPRPAQTRKKGTGKTRTR